MLVVALLSVGLPACDNKESSPEPTTVPVDNPLVGTWIYQEIPYYSWPNYTFYADGTYVGIAEYADDKGKYFYNENLMTLTLSGTYTKIKKESFGHSVGESNSFTFNVLSLSDTDLVVTFLYSDGELKTFHFEKSK